tara:strand:- start:27 stop:233 length:207 start_codon:yes stop_codon:yes gene_type:complete
MTKQLTKRSKATYYKHRLDKAIDILQEVKKVTESFEYIGVEQIFELEEAINKINFKIDNLLEDMDDED